MSRKPQASQSQSVESIIEPVNEVKEEIMNNEVNEEITLDENEAAIVTTGGNTLILRKEDLIAVKSMAKTMNKEYARKAKEIEYQDHRPKPKGSVDYDRDMYGRTQVLLAFVNAVLDSIEIPTKKDRTAELVAAFGGQMDNEEA